MQVKLLIQTNGAISISSRSKEIRIKDFLILEHVISIQLLRLKGDTDHVRSQEWKRRKGDGNAYNVADLSDGGVIGDPAIGDDGIEERFHHFPLLEEVFEKDLLFDAVLVVFLRLN